MMIISQPLRSAISTSVAAGSPTRTPISLDNYTQWTTTLGVGLAFR